METLRHPPTYRLVMHQHRELLPKVVQATTTIHRSPLVQVEDCIC
jgi:hypothetical protein